MRRPRSGGPSGLASAEVGKFIVHLKQWSHGEPRRTFRHRLCFNSQTSQKNHSPGISIQWSKGLLLDAYPPYQKWIKSPPLIQQPIYQQHKILIFKFLHKVGEGCKYYLNRYSHYSIIKSKESKGKERKFESKQMNYKLKETLKGFKNTQKNWHIVLLVNEEKLF